MFKVSIVVPVYNVEQYLSRCLESLVNQTLQNIEILVINDSSPDNSQVIIDDYAKKYPNMIKSFIKPNGGISSVRNFGIKHATGEYIAFVDSDDYVEHDMFEIMYNAAIINNANVVISDFYFTYPDKEIIYNEFPYNDSKSMIINLFAVLWNKLYKKEYLDKLNIGFMEGYRFEDVSFLMKMAVYHERFHFVAKPLIHYVQRQDSITASHNYQVKDIVFILNDILAFYKERGYYHTYQSELEYFFIRFTLGQPFRSCSKITDQEDRKYSLDLLWKTLNDNFPNWKSNQYIKTLPGLKNRYFNLINRPLYHISAFINRLL
ncbi:MAG: glycosyltransferase [Erysipelotrichaceae bacterium]|nr:glycosyltransferase [Erysipelotrichaceae bacterium]